MAGRESENAATGQLYAYLSFGGFYFCATGRRRCSSSHPLHEAAGSLAVVLLGWLAMVGWQARGPVFRTISLMTCLCRLRAKTVSIHSTVTTGGKRVGGVSTALEGGQRVEARCRKGGRL